MTQTTKLLLTSFASALLLTGCLGAGGRATPPTPPAKMHTQSEPRGVEVNWENLDAAGSYMVYRCPASAQGEQKLDCSDSDVRQCGSAVGHSAVNRFFDTPAIGSFSCYRIASCVGVSGTSCGPLSAPVGGQRYRAEAVISEGVHTAASGETVTLAGRARHTTGNVSYLWQQISGPKVTLKDKTSPTTSFSDATAVSELLSFKLDITDDQGFGEAAKLAVNISPEGAPGLFTQGKPRYVTSGDPVTLHAIGSPVSRPVFSWSQQSPASPQVPLANADSNNPSFVAPAVTAVTEFVFGVRYSNADTGLSSTSKVHVFVRPAQDGQLTGVPLTVAGGAVLEPPTPALKLSPPPNASVFSGADAKLTMGVLGGVQPYTWTWELLIGPADTQIAVGDEDILEFTAPTIDQAQPIAFKATVVDAEGTSKSANVFVKVFPLSALGQDPGDQPPEEIVHPLITGKIGDTITVTTRLSNPSITQTSGTLGVLQTSSPTAGLTNIALTLPNIAEDYETLEVTATGEKKDGKLTQDVFPIAVVRTKDSPPPPQVLAEYASLPDPISGHLIVTNCGAAEAYEGQRDVVLGVCPKGGTGQYEYVWHQPFSEVMLSDAFTSHPRFNAPNVDQDAFYPFVVQVTDGVETIEHRVDVFIHDVPPITPDVGVGTREVPSGTTVVLDSPWISGGVPPYSWTITQNSGQSVGPLTGRNPSFQAPTPANGTSESLDFGYRIVDAIGNRFAWGYSVLVITQQDLLAALNVPGSAYSGTQVRLQTPANGGTPPYTYAYEVDGAPNAALVGPNPMLQLPNVDQGQQTLTLKMTVTDSGTPQQSIVASAQLAVVAEPPFDPSSSFLPSAVQPDSQTAQDALTRFPNICDSGIDVSTTCWDDFGLDNGVHYCSNSAVYKLCAYSCGVCPLP